MSESLEDLTRRAVQLLDEALGKPPGELKHEVEEVERAVVALRDHLIERLRATDVPPAADAPLRLVLDRTNVALSLVVAIEYPVGGVQRGLIEQARSTLARLDARLLASAQDGSVGGAHDHGSE